MVTKQSIIALEAELESIVNRLIAITDSTERAALLDEMRAILSEVEVLIKAAESEITH